MAALGACGALWQLLRRHPHSWSLEDRQQAVRQWGRLSLLIIGGGTLFLYVLSPNSALYPVATSRYLIGLLIVTPALLYPLWQGLLVLKPLLVFISSRFFLSSRVEHDSMVIGCVILSGVVLIFAFGTFSTFTGIPPAPVANAVNNVYFTQNSTRHLDVPATWALNQRESNLIQRLLGMHVHSIYSDYWTCDRLIFQSREKLICSVITDNLRSGHDRYPLYPALVRADYGATYVLLQNSQADSNFARGIKTHVITIPYQRFVFDGYSVYVPVRHPAPTSNAL
jgi:hypothetical protein